MKQSKSIELSCDDKLEMIKTIRSEFKKYYGKWVALDEKDRLISYGKNRIGVLDDVNDFSFWLKNHGIKLYKIYDPHDRQLIISLLDDVF